LRIGNLPAWGRHLPGVPSQAAANCARGSPIGIFTISGDPRWWLLPAAVIGGRAIRRGVVIPAIEPAIPGIADR